MLFFAGENDELVCFRAETIFERNETKDIKSEWNQVMQYCKMQSSKKGVAKAVTAICFYCLTIIRNMKLRNACCYL